MWLDPDGHVIRDAWAGGHRPLPLPDRDRLDRADLPRFGERAALLERRYGTVVLDEAHKARRRGGLGEHKDEPNNLLDFMLQIGPRTKNLLLGTATPIQTEVYELWDLMAVLNAGVDFVLGRDYVSRWADWEQALPFVKGEQSPADDREAWEWLRNPLPPAGEDPLFATLRLGAGIDDRRFFTDRGFGSLGPFTQATHRAGAGAGVLPAPEPAGAPHRAAPPRDAGEPGLLERVGVTVHPIPRWARPPTRVGFRGSRPADEPPLRPGLPGGRGLHRGAGARTKAAGFMKTLLLQRICSSFASGRATAERMLRREILEDEEDAERLSGGARAR